MAVDMKRTFSASFMREEGEAGIDAWKAEVEKAIVSSVDEARRITSAHQNVTVFLERSA